MASVVYKKVGCLPYRSIMGHLRTKSELVSSLAQTLQEKIVQYSSGTIYQPLRSGRIWHKVSFF